MKNKGDKGREKILTKNYIGSSITTNYISFFTNKQVQLDRSMLLSSLEYSLPRNHSWLNEYLMHVRKNS